MNIRTRFEKVTFKNAFRLPGMDKTHAPGEFEVRVVEEPLDVMWEGYHRTLTIMLTAGGLTEAIAITESALEEALAADGTPASAA